MKVMCINDYFISTKNGQKTLINPQVGEIVNVIGVNSKGNYSLSEYPSNGFHPTFWNKDKFIPTSDIDETELVKERELVC